jgi:hypothetical protein
MKRSFPDSASASDEIKRNNAKLRRSPLLLKKPPILFQDSSNKGLSRHSSAPQSSQDPREISQIDLA